MTIQLKELQTELRLMPIGVITMTQVKLWQELEKTLLELGISLTLNARKKVQLLDAKDYDEPLSEFIEANIVKIRYMLGIKRHANDDWDYMLSDYLMFDAFHKFLLEDRPQGTVVEKRNKRFKL